MKARWPGAQGGRRGFLRAALGVGAGAVLVGCGSGGVMPPPTCGDPFAGGELLKTLGFRGEGPAPLDQPLDAGLDGRLYTDLSGLTTDSLVIQNARFFIRTRYPDRLKPSGHWLIRTAGLVKQPGTLRLDDLMPGLRPMGTYVRECSGNGRAAYFGLLSASAWSGILISEVLALLDPLPRATRVLISGFDDYSHPSWGSIARASWIFSFEQLTRAGAFWPPT